MKMMFMVFDKKTQVYDQPFMAMSFGAVERMMDKTVKEGKSIIAEYPDDFMIFHVGSFEETTGKIELIDHVPVGTVSDFVTRVIPDESEVRLLSPEEKRFMNAAS